MVANNPRSPQTMANLVVKLLDQALNRATGVYSGFKPREPNALVIPGFVAIEEKLPSLAEALDNFVDLQRLLRPLVLTDPVTWDIAGAELFKGLQDMGSTPLRANVTRNAYQQAEAVVMDMSRGPRLWSAGEHPWERRLYAPKLPSVVFGVGGGTVMDMAKLVAFQLHIPCVTIPTSLANDGIASPFAVIRPPQGRGSVTVKANTPLGVLIDLARIKPRPGDRRGFFVRMMQSGIGDAVSNLTSTMDWRLATYMGKDRLDYMALLQARSAGEVVLYRVNRGAALDDDDLVMTLAAALVSSGEAMARVGSSRPASGFEHKLYHAFQNLLCHPSGASHGILVAIGSLLSAAVHERWYKRMRRCFQRVGLPVDAHGLAGFGIRPAHLEEAIQVAVQVKPERYTILEHVGSQRMIHAFRSVFGIET